MSNSNLRTEGLLGGASYTWDEGYFGLAYSGFHSQSCFCAVPKLPS